jgi:hypothetical protein
MYYIEQQYIKTGHFAQAFVVARGIYCSESKE